MNAGHDWQVWEFDDTYMGQRVEWCSLCGALRYTCKGITNAVELYFPYAYMKVSETTCSLARKLREDDKK